MSLEERKKYDARVRKLFYALFVLLIVWITYSLITEWGRDIFNLMNSVLNGLVTVFLIIGLFSLRYYWNHGTIKTGKILKYLLSVSFLLTFLTLIVGYSLYRPFLLPILQEFLPGMSSSIMPVIVFLIFLLSYLVGFLLLFIQSFGLISVIVIFQRKYFPKILDYFKEMDLKSEEENTLGKFYRNLLIWIFNIPKVLDTSEITVDKKIEERFSWENFWKAFLLESILAVVLAIYISLNPLLLAERSLSELFSLASVVSYFIPVVVLPLFIFLKLNFKIPGPAADFYLFQGLRSRLLGLIVTLGTLLFFLRLALRTFDPGLLIYSFLFYFAGFLMNTFFITFVYFNYFENPLAKDLLEELSEK
ncbi:MAG: hypothetical protein ACLFSM_08195 [Thermoplasmata archaeon]